MSEYEEINEAMDVARVTMETAREVLAGLTTLLEQRTKERDAALLERDEYGRAEAAALEALHGVITALGWTSETATPDDHAKIIAGVAAVKRERDAARAVLVDIEHVWLPGMSMQDRRCPVCRSPNEFVQPHEDGCKLAANLPPVTT